MPATLNQVLDLQTSVEESVRTYFSGQGFAAFTRVNAPEDFQRDRPRVEISTQNNFSATGHRYLCADGVLRFDYFAMAISVQVVTNQKGTDQANAEHAQYCASVRAMMSNAAQTSWTDTTNFPNHLIAEHLRETGCSHVVENGAEMSAITYAGIVCVRSSAWPTS